MPAFITIRDNVIIDERSGAKTEIRNENDKYYATVLKCGHCHSPLYFLPIIFVIVAKDAKSAVYIAKKMPRVKRDHKDFIVDVCEISKQEAVLIKLCNENDPFIKTESKKTDNIENTLKRRIIEPNSIQQVDKVKTADEYDQEDIVERYCAPVLIGDSLKYPRKLNMNQLIQEFLTNRVQKYGCDKHFISMVALYYQIYGKDNALNIHYFQDTQQVQYYTSDGQTIIKKLPLQIIDHMPNEDNSNNSINEDNTSDTSRAKSKRPSAAERFNARLAKSQTSAQNKSSPPHSQGSAEDEFV